MLPPQSWNFLLKYGIFVLVHYFIFIHTLNIIESLICVEHCAYNDNLSMGKIYGYMMIPYKDFVRKLMSMFVKNQLTNNEFKF